MTVIVKDANGRISSTRLRRRGLVDVARASSRGWGYTVYTACNLNYRTNNGTLPPFKVDGLNQLTNAVGGLGKYDPSGNLMDYAGITYT